MDNSHVQKKETGESYIDWLWNKEHDEERYLVIEEVACDIRHESHLLSKKDRNK